MKETEPASAPKFAPGNKAYLLDKVKNKYIFTPYLIVGAETLPSNPQIPAPKRNVYVLDGKPFGTVYSEKKLFTHDEAKRTVSEKPEIYSIKNERARK